MKSHSSSREWLLQALFVGPALLVFTIIVALPFALGLYYSLTDWNGVSEKVQWIGLGNFRTLASDEGFWDSFGFTARFTLVAVVLTNAVGFALALILTRYLKLRNVLRTIFFLPNVIGGLLLGFIWQFIFVKGFAAMGNWTGLSFFELPWLGDATTAFWAVVIVSVWTGAGYLMVIYIASLTNVPADLYEAASIDGASSLQRLFKITIPMIMPAITIGLFLALSWSFKTFDVILSLTRGGPYNSTQSVALNIYTEAFQNNQLGLGTAKAIVFFLVVALITMVQVWFTKRQEVEA
ncbi:carbohydrate ABC transporter permease [Cohnella luojiensis]|uniref:Sugar ABC transporter permease n=1 Tax=Cohnella luojiensis TaxID=652876 RepID=A0A4Y8LNB4_9BACL|nr:sugar ABC transporter permease [Cohnella luojiensis]TFE19767.1 sugar ABC transporter permease [Cohnella luojiensis]